MFRLIEPSSGQIPVLCFVFGLMVAQLAETCRRVFNINCQYMLCLLTG